MYYSEKIKLYMSMLNYYMEELDFETGEGRVDPLGYSFLSKDIQEKWADQKKAKYNGMLFVLYVFDLYPEFDYLLTQCKQWIKDKMVELDLNPKGLKPVKPHHAWLELRVNKRLFKKLLNKWIKEYKKIIRGGING